MPRTFFCRPYGTKTLFSPSKPGSKLPGYLSNVPMGHGILSFDIRFLKFQISLVSLWEMQIKTQLGKLALDVPLAELWHQQQVKADLSLLPVKEAHIWELGALPHLHKDPFDRLLVAQAKYEKIALISADDCMPRYETTIVW